MSGLVDFIVVGAQKAGTTALFEHLGEEPDLALSDVKEVHYFDDDGLDWAAPDHDRYHRHFPPADGRLRGEATPIYVYWPNSLERIRAYNPDVRLILMLRDPVERAWSHWRMEYARGVETRPFAWCVREGRQRLFDADPWGFHREHSYVERGFYGEQVERLFGLFRREQALILRAEALRERPDDVLGQVRAFLGLPARAARRTPRVVHGAREMDYGERPTPADLALLREIYARDMARLAELTGVCFA
jgi:hypothetical protein